jgi:hypothetical protein
MCKAFSLGVPGRVMMQRLELPGFKFFGNGSNSGIMLYKDFRFGNTGYHIRLHFGEKAESLQQHSLGQRPKLF